VLKLSFVSTHYAHPFNFSLDKLKQSQAAYEKITALLEKTAQLKPAQGVVALPDEMRHTAMRYNEEFFSCMRDDFNTPSAVAALFDLVNYAQKIFLDDSVGAAVKSAFLKDTFTPLLTRLGAVIGIRFQGAATQESRALTEGLRAARDTFSKDAALQEVFSALGVRAAGDPYNVIHAVIDARNRARAQKDFTRADALRAFLREAGVALEDTKDTTFFKITHHG